MVGEHEAERLKWGSGTDIESKPGRYVPDCNLLGIINKEVRVAIEVRNKEGENDVNSKEAIDNVVKNEKSIFLVSQECKLEWTDPGRVND